MSKASIIQQTDTATPSIGSYLYEPNASIMKLGCFGDVAEQFSVIPIAQNSHLYVSDTSIAEFPGRQFLINKVIPFRDREIKALRKRFDKMNVSTRNFRLSAEALRQRLHVKDGGDFYLFATTLASGELVLLLTTKINS